MHLYPHPGANTGNLSFAGFVTILLLLLLVLCFACGEEWHSFSSLFFWLFVRWGMEGVLLVVVDVLFATLFHEVSVYACVYLLFGIICDQSSAPASGVQLVIQSSTRKTLKFQMETR